MPDGKITESNEKSNEKVTKITKNFKSNLLLVTFGKKVTVTTNGYLSNRYSKALCGSNPLYCYQVTPGLLHLSQERVVFFSFCVQKSSKFRLLWRRFFFPKFAWERPRDNLSKKFWGRNSCQSILERQTEW